jgi:hypothetical protein
MLVHTVQRLNKCIRYCRLGVLQECSARVANQFASTTYGTVPVEPYICEKATVCIYNEHLQIYKRSEDGFHVAADCYPILTTDTV